MDQKSVNLFLCGFGVGLSWGTIFAEIPTENILPVIETSEHYDEDKIPARRLAEYNILVVGADRPLGENISRYLNEKHANVILAGADKDKLSDISKSFFFRKHIIEDSELDISLFDSVAQYCEAEDICLHGIIFLNEDIKPDVISKAGRKLLERGCISNGASGTSIVLVSNIETLRSENIQMYDEKKAELSDILSQIQKNTGTDNIRVNAVLYDETMLELTQITGNGQAWIEKYLQENRPKEMKRPLILGNAVMYFVSGDSMYTTGAMISINR